MINTQALMEVPLCLAIHVRKSNAENDLYNSTCQTIGYVEREKQVAQISGQ